ncbi:MAG: class I SAM-dependent methyltransferase [Gammaproteobacteria bacterium]|nr:class I SAM-dependent methyltransferase [Gammaproteobacteria bacterium]
MTMNRALGAGVLALVIGTGATAPALAVNDSAIAAAVAGPQRSESNRLRDRYRHPLQTLSFFGLRADMTVVELSPGAGWYTEIIAPVLRGQGRLYAAHFPVSLPGMPDWMLAMHKEFAARFADAGTFGEVTIAELRPDAELAPAGSADLVLTFRNVHNWIKAGTVDAVFANAYRALKPGGVFGVVEHRAPAGTSVARMAETGYVTEAEVVRVAEQAGFRLDGRSELNANPADTHTHPAGVWTLPPTLRLGDQDRDKYFAIGESDRMTLRFIKPD